MNNKIDKITNTMDKSIEIIDKILINIDSALEILVTIEEKDKLNKELIK